MRKVGNLVALSSPPPTALGIGWRIRPTKPAKMDPHSSFLMSRPPRVVGYGIFRVLPRRRTKADVGRYEHCTELLREPLMTRAVGFFALLLASCVLLGPAIAGD